MGARGYTDRHFSGGRIDCLGAGNCKTWGRRRFSQRSEQTGGERNFDRDRYRDALRAWVQVARLTFSDTLEASLTIA